MRTGSFVLVVLVLIGLLLGVSIAGLPNIITVSLLAGMLFLYLALCHPRLIIAVLLCVAPFNIVWIGIGITIPEIVYSSMYVLLAVSWGFKKMLDVIFRGKTGSISSPVTFPLIGFLSAALLAFTIGILRGHKLWQCSSDLNAIMYYGLCFIMLEEIRNRKELYRFFILITVAAFLSLIRGLYHLIAVNPPVDIGIEVIYKGLSVLRDASVFALIMFILSTAMTFILPKGKRRFVFILLSLFFSSMGILSFARSLWVAAVFGLAFLFFMSLGRQKTNFVKLALMAIITLSVYVSIAMSMPADNPLHKSIYAVEKRYESIFTAKEESSIMTRDSEWYEAKRRAFQHPFLGNGLGTEFTYFRYDTWRGMPRWDTTRYVHNAYLFIFLNMGLVGLLSFLWLSLSFIRYGLRVYRSLETGIGKALSLGITAGFASLMVMSLAGPLLVSPIVTIWLGFFMGALIMIDRLR